MSNFARTFQTPYERSTPFSAHQQMEPAILPAPVVFLPVPMICNSPSLSRTMLGDHDDPLS